MSSHVVKVEPRAEACCVCGRGGGEALLSPEEHDAAAADPPPAPTRAMLLHLNANKVVPSGRLCSDCIHRTIDAYNFSTQLASNGPPPLSEKIRALRERLYELTQKIDVFIVVGGAAGADGAYGADDVISVPRVPSASASASASAPLADPAPLQCSLCPQTFQQASAHVAHVSAHSARSARGAHWCWACGARCASAAALAEHARTHAPPDPLHCTLCTRTFQSAAEMRGHEARCRAVCPACGVRCPTHGALRTHAATHAAVCAACLAHCRTPEARAAHALQHARAARYVCGYRACILRFTTRSSLLAHIRKCHGGTELDEPPAPRPRTAHAPPVPCEHCPRTFGSTAAMRRHARTHRRRDAPQEAEWRAGADDNVEYLELEALDDGL